MCELSRSKASESQKPLRVGFLIDRFDVGGTELNAVKVAESLISRSVDLTVFHLSESGPLRARYERANAHLIHVPISSLLSTSAWRVMTTVKQQADKRELMLLHGHCIYSNILGAGAARLPGRHLPFLASRRWTGSVPRRSLGALNRVAQSLADGVLVNSPSLVRRVRKESPFSKPFYVPNLIPEVNFQQFSPEETAARRTFLRLPSGGPTVGCVARLTVVKDHINLLYAWERVVAKVPSAHLVIVGEGPTRPIIEKWIEQHNMRESVSLLGEMSPDSLPHALLDVSVLASLDEGFPNSLLEAMAQGVPVVSTRVGGIPDLIEHGRNGLLVEASHPEQLADAIVQILKSRVNVSALREAGLATAERHREVQVTDLLLQLYDHLRGIQRQE